MYGLGVCYYFGQGIEQNIDKAVELFAMVMLVKCGVLISRTLQTSSISSVKPSIATVQRALSWTV